MLLPSSPLKVTFLLLTVLPLTGTWFSSPIPKRTLEWQYLAGGWLWVAKCPNRNASGYVLGPRDLSGAKQ